MARQPNDIARTLDRGLQVLELLGDHPGGMTIAQVATELDLDRTIVHRLLRTLGARRFVKPDEGKRYQLSFGLLRLAETISRDLRSIALPVLEELADTVCATANIAIPDGEDVVVLTTVVPRQAQVHVAYRAGLRHPLVVGAAGIAILANRPPHRDERDQVATARAHGYAVTHEEVIGNTWGVSAPLDVPGRRIEGSVGVSLFQGEDVEDACRAVGVAARRISDALSARYALSPDVPGPQVSSIGI